MYWSTSNSASTFIDKLSDIEDSYDIFIIDMVGVIYDEKHPLPGAIDALKRLIEKNKNIYLLTNNPRPNHIARNKLNALGFPPNLNIFTSGDATRIYIEKKYKGKKVFHLGENKNTDILNGVNVTRTDTIKDADFILLSAFIEEEEDPDQFNIILKEMSESNKEIICSNPDIYAFFGKTRRKTAGYFTKIIESYGGKVTYMGKPNNIIYELLWETYKIPLEKKNVSLMVGDTLETDIQGGHNFEIDSILVLSGNTGHEIKKKNMSPLSYLNHLSNISPLFVCKTFS